MTTLRPTTDPATTPTDPPARRWTGGALWALQGLLALVFAGSAVPKVTAQPDAVAGFADLGFGTAGMVTIGVLELIGAVALLVPRLCGLAALAFVGLMTGAVALTVLRLDAVDAVFPAVLLLLAAVVTWGRRHRTSALLTQLR